MFPALKERQDTTGFKDMTEELVDIEMAAHGVTVVEVARDGEDWRIVLNSPHNRRISPLSAMAADGPAAGDKRLQTSGDPSGKSLVGTLNNCAGGMTPWNTYLTAEENFHFYFWTDQRDADNKPVTGIGGEQAESTRAMGCRRSGRPGASSTTASMSTRSRTSPTVSAGSWRSIRSTRISFR
jgi:hypothetical protein